MPADPVPDDGATLHQTSPTRRNTPDANFAAVLTGTVAAIGVVAAGPYFERIVDFSNRWAPLVPVTASLMVVTVAKLWRSPKASTTSIVAVSVLALVLVFGGSMLILSITQTAPGRAARSAAGSWDQVLDSDFHEAAACTDLPADAHGTGRQCPHDGALEIHLAMKGLPSASQETTGLTRPLAGTWYAEVRARLVDGPSDAVCALVFGHLAENRFYALRVQGELLQMTSFSGAGAAPSLLLTALPRGVHTDQWIRLGLLLRGTQATVFANDRWLAEETIDPPPDGTVDLATILPRGNRPYQATCAFDDLLVAAKRS
jgi:hypothetical protein